MKKQIITSFTYQDGNAEKVMNFYVALFDNLKIINIRRWGPLQREKSCKLLFQ